MKFWGRIKCSDSENHQQPWPNTTCPYSATYSTSVHKQARMGRISSKRGSSGNGLNWAMRSPWQRGPPRCRAGKVGEEGGGCGREFHAEEVWSGRESLFTFFTVFREILMAAVQALTVMNSSHTLTDSLTHTHTHTHTHHYITDYNSYITRPCGHWGNYSLLTSAPAGQINKNAFFLFFFL